MEEKSFQLTKGVKDLLGDPKKALLKISVPMMIGMFIILLYQLADGFWIAGLGADALAGVGLFFPFFLFIMAIGAGLGTGGSSAISRRIGEQNKKDADSTAIHTIFIGFILGLLITIFSIVFIDRLFFSIVGNREVSMIAIEYGRILFFGAIIIIFSNVANAILRGEGDAKKAMYGLVVGSVLNIFLDPIFIYYLNFGVSGAAWATFISLSISGFLFIYWLFLKKNIYLNLTFKNFKFNKKIMKEILSVGVPASLGQLSVSFSIFLINFVVIISGGTDGVAIFTSGWRVVMIGVIPLLGLSAGVTAVTGAAFGKKDKEKLKQAYYYSIKIGLIIEFIIAFFVFIFAPQMAFMFTYSEASYRIFDGIVDFLRITSFYYLMIPFGVVVASMFRGIGKGLNSLMIIILRSIFLQVLFAYIFGVTLGFGLNGIWAGFVFGTAISSIIAIIWAKLTFKTIPS